MKTAFLLMHSEGKAVIPVEQVCQDYFSHLRVNELIQKLTVGEIPIPLARMEASRRCAKESIWWIWRVSGYTNSGNAKGANCSGAMDGGSRSQNRTAEIVTMAWASSAPPRAGNVAQLRPWLAGIDLLQSL